MLEADAVTTRPPEEWLQDKLQFHIESAGSPIGPKKPVWDKSNLIKQIYIYSKQIINYIDLEFKNTEHSTSLANKELEQKTEAK